MLNLVTGSFNPKTDYLSVLIQKGDLGVNAPECSELYFDDVTPGTAQMALHRLHKWGLASRMKIGRSHRYFANSRTASRYNFLIERQQEKESDEDYDVEDSEEEPEETEIVEVEIEDLDELEFDEDEEIFEEKDIDDMTIDELNMEIMEIEEDLEI